MTSLKVKNGKVGEQKIRPANSNNIDDYDYGNVNEAKIKKCIKIH